MPPPYASPLAVKIGEDDQRSVAPATLETVAKKRDRQSVDLDEQRLPQIKIVGKRIEQAYQQLPFRAERLRHAGDGYAGISRHGLGSD